MTEVVGVRFREEGKVYYFDPKGVAVESGTDVIVETSRGIEFGVCASGNESIEDSLVVQPLRPMIRIANAEDKKQWQENRKKEAEAFTICENKILEHDLAMKLVEVEYTLDGSKILFFFTSEGRVDFRELVKELASIFRTRIELRQIGVRDEAKMLGGLGICGRPFCCTTFMDEFQPVSIKMAKTQNLSLNPTKISGTCGRLMCCLKYEQDTYEHLISNSVKQDSYVKTADGKGHVTEVNLFKGTVKVHLEGDPDSTNQKTYKNNQIFVIRSGKKGPMQPEPEHMPEPEPEPEPEIQLPEFEIKAPANEPEEPKKEQTDHPNKKSHNNRRRKKSGNAQQQDREASKEKQAKQPQPRPAVLKKQPEGPPDRQLSAKNEKPYKQGQKKGDGGKPDSKKQEPKAQVLQEAKKQQARPMGGHGSRHAGPRNTAKGTPQKNTSDSKEPGRQQAK